jgi:hypothetical protein
MRSGWLIKAGMGISGAILNEYDKRDKNVGSSLNGFCNAVYIGISRYFIRTMIIVEKFI